MPKWEYMYVQVEAAQNVWKPRYVNGQELADWKHLPQMEIFIDQMGEQEWELFSYCPFWATRYALVKEVDLTIESIQLIFKRPKLGMSPSPGNTGAAPR